jgi:hypothetical protein
MAVHMRLFLNLSKSVKMWMTVACGLLLSASCVHVLTPLPAVPFANIVSACLAVPRVPQPVSVASARLQRLPCIEQT